MTILIQRRVREFQNIVQDWTLLTGLLVATLFIALAIVFPLVRMIGISLSAEALPLFVAFLTKPLYQHIVGNTVILGVGVATFGTLLGLLFAFVQVRVAVPFKRFMHLMALLPIVSPPFAVATAAITLFGRSGIITYRLLGLRYDIYGLDGLLFVLALSFFPVAYLNLVGMMRALDPSLDEAAINLGAGRWHMFRTVTLPLLVPGLAGSFLLLFAEAIADLANPLVLGGDFTVLAARVYIAITGEYDVVAGAVLSVILLLPSLSVFIIQRYWVGRKSAVSVTGRPSGRPQQITAPLPKWTLFALTMALSLLIFLIYATVVVGAFTQLLGLNNTFTLDHFGFVFFGYGSKAMTDTTTLAVLATPLAGLLGMLIAFLVVRKQFTGRGLLDFASMLGMAVPGTVLGIGYLLAFNRPLAVGGMTLLPKLTGGAGLLGGALAIVAVYVVRSVPASVRAGAAALHQIHPDIEEASTNLGANGAATFRRVTLPLTRPALLSGLIYAFARSMTTLSPIIFLTTPETRIMTAQILNEVDAGRFGNAFAYCVILITIVLGAIGLLYALVGSATGAERTLEAHN